MIKKILQVFLVLILIASVALSEGIVNFAPNVHNAPYIDVEFLKANPFTKDAQLMKIDYLKVGIGDCILIRSDNITILIDGGTKIYINALENFLKENKIDKIDYLINTHPHDDHIEAQTRLVKHGFNIGEFLSPFNKKFNDYFQKLMVVELDKKNIPYNQVFSGETLSLGNLKIKFMRNMNKAFAKGLNAKSMQIYIKYKDRSILLTSDVTSSLVHDELFTHYPECFKNVDIMDYPHHGYVNVANNYINKINPKAVIITNRKTNAILAHEQLLKMKIPHYFTTTASLHLETDGKTWYISQSENP